MILETERLYLREMNQSDFDSLCSILQDEDTMYAHKGYAIEAAKACKTYAFEILKADEVCSIIRDTNIASQNVAIRNGMTMTGTWTKHYRGVDMPHYRYVVSR